MSIHIYKIDEAKNTSYTGKQILVSTESNTKKMANLRGKDLFATWENWNLSAELHIKKVSQKSRKKERDMKDEPLLHFCNLFTCRVQLTRH